MTPIPGTFVGFWFILLEHFMWLAIEVVSALYLVSFIWLWRVSRTSVHRKTKAGAPAQASNLIPFERRETREQTTGTRSGVA